MPLSFQSASYSSPRRDAVGVTGGGRGLALNGVIARREDLNPGLTRLTIALDGWELEPFRAGQYIDIALQQDATDVHPVALSSLPSGEVELVRRSYSIASDPRRRGEVELLINLVPQGEFTTSLWRLNEGDRVHVEPRVRGRFTLETVPADADVLMLATGTGIAPFISMVRRHAREGDAWRHATLMHSVRLAEDLAYRKELEALEGDLENFRYVPTVTREPERTGWRGLRERVQPLLEPARYEGIVGRPLDPARTHIYLCGNPAMIQSLVPDLLERGFTPHTPQRKGTLHVESYW